MEGGPISRKMWQNYKQHLKKLAASKCWNTDSGGVNRLNNQCLPNQRPDHTRVASRSHIIWLVGHRFRLSAGLW